VKDWPRSTPPRTIGTEYINAMPHIRTVLDFSRVPIVNRNWVDLSIDLPSVYHLVHEDKLLSARLKVVNAILKDVAPKAKARASTQWTDAQALFLKQHGIQADIYAGVANEVASTADSDSYFTRRFEFQLKGAVALPSFEDLKEMKAYKEASDPKKAKKDGVSVKKPNYIGEEMLQIQADTLNAVARLPTEKRLAYLTERQEEMEAQQARLRHQLNSVRLARIVTYDLFPDMVINDKKGEYVWTPPATAGADLPPLVLKTEYTKEYVDRAE
jgi:hypothetical protein